VADRPIPHGELPKQLLASLANEAKLQYQLDLLRNRRTWRATAPLRSQRVSRILQHLPSIFGGNQIPFEEISPLTKWRQSDEYVDVLDQISRQEKGSRVGVLVHLHYADLWEEVQKSLEPLTDVSQILITATPDAYRKVAPSILSQDRIAIIQIDNSGRDMGAFFKSLAWISEHEDWRQCSAFLRLHGKRSPHLSNGNAWRQNLFDVLVRSAPAVTRSFNSDPLVGVIGDLNSPYLNQDLEANRISFHTSWNPPEGFDWHSFKSTSFPVGGMFWFRPELVNEYRRLGVDSRAFASDKPAATDGQTPHLLERLIGWWPSYLGYRVCDANSTTDEQILKYAATHSSDGGEKLVQALTRYVKRD